MNPYQTALDATEAHLRSLKARGVRYLDVRPETLQALGRPLPARISAPAAPVAHLENAPANLANSLSTPPVLRNFSEGGSGEKTKESAQLPNELPNRAPVQEAPSVSSPISPPGGERGPSPLTVAAPISPQLAPASPLTQPDKEEAMASLRARALSCTKCPHLASSRRNVVFGVGSLNARLMFVGEAPGADEDAQGEPFVGAAGQLLTKMIQAMGFTRQTVYIANILKCRPDTPGQSSGNRKPSPEEMRTCLPYLLEQIDLIQPAVLVALGATAVEGLLGKGDGIGKLRGCFLQFRGIPLMPTFHPAYLLRNQAMSERRKVWEDLLQALEKLGEPISAKQRGFFLKGA